ncbi:MAG: 30S ribosomal protein S8 [Deltaproteobacteria bacterium]|nr:30S ribosomal protein S8 [Deltaproteobacteria bacterium]MBN2673241.1 30S ribosomal protein S8 [Deltaproteobacteria bacterium]
MLDPVADLMTRIRNAGMARHSSTRIPHSKMKERIGNILKEEGYIADIEVAGEVPKKEIIVHLKYGDNHKLAINSMKRVSKSGCRTYAGAKDIPLINQGLGVSIISTSKGIITDKEARRLNVGGEVLCEIW